jgi:hypothetical protein
MKGKAMYDLEFFKFEGDIRNRLQQFLVNTAIA